MGGSRRLQGGFTAFVRLARLENAVLPCLGVLVGYYAHTSRNGSQLGLRLLILVLLHSIVTIWNDLTDEDVDKLNRVGRTSVVRQHGLYKALLFWLGVAAVGSGVIAWCLPSDAVFILALYLLIGWCYNNRPFRASRRPLASIALLALAYGLIPFLLGSGVQDINWKLSVLALSWTAVRTSLSLLKDYKDAPGDAKVGKRTFLLTYGNRVTMRASLVLTSTGYIGCIWLVALYAGHPLSSLITMIPVGGWLLYERSKLLQAATYDQLNGVFHACLQYEILFDCLAVVWLRTR